MKYSNFFLPTLKDAPSDADIISSKLMIRSGMIRKLASGVYEWLPLGLRILKKVENIVREEMNKACGQEVSLPMLLPKGLWDETKRWELYGNELFKLKDRKEADFCLGPTHEEAITDLVRRDVRSYKQLPLMLYQFGTKFRDEIRPRFGIMRAREFYMKDAYSFHATESDIDSYYETIFNAYKKICDRCGFKYRVVEASSGAIGGKFSHEFMVLADTGEEEIPYCRKCGYASNTEKTECLRPVSREQSNLQPPEEVHTPNMRTVEEVSKFMNASADNFIKTLIYTVDQEPVMVLIRGDYEVNEHKLQNYFPNTVIKLAENDIVENITGALAGFVGPVNTRQKIKIIADYSVENVLNGISGANKKDFHLKNINPARDFKWDDLTDLRQVVKGDVCARCKDSVLEFARGIEVGHTFKLGMKYSKSMSATFLDAQGKQQNFIMGCYGIGVSRIVAASIEQSHDENGIIWQINIAPFHVIVIPVDYKDENVKQVSDRIYKELQDKNIDVLIDDRDERPGIKFKDADLIGIPVRITVGARNLPDNVEFKLRAQQKASLLKIEDAINKATELVRG